MKFTPIALQYILDDTIHASSGVYITSTSSSFSPFILTVNHFPRIDKYSIYANYGANKSSSQVNWHRVSILEDVTINASDFEFFDTHNQFNLYPRDQFGKTLSILKLSAPGFTIESTTSKSLGLVSRKKPRAAIGDQVAIVSSPFNFTNSLIFHQFTTIARIVYKVHQNDQDADNGEGIGDYWLSDAAYMENMAGGAVIQKTLNTGNSGISTGASNNIDVPGNRLIGLVLGNLRKTNGDGNLMVIIPLQKIIQLSPTLIPPPSSPSQYPNSSSSLIKSSSSIIYKTLSSTTLSKLFNLPSLSTKLTSKAQGDPKSVLPLIINASNHRIWGSCIFYKDQLLITNSHVVAPFFPNHNKSSTPATATGNPIFNRRKLHFDPSDDSATILITSQGDSIQVNAPLEQNIIIPHPDLDLAFIQIDQRASLLLLENGFRPITPVSSIEKGPDDAIVEGDAVYTQSFGLFFDPLYLQPLKSHGIINCVYRHEVGVENDSASIGPGLIIASASCYNGSSGGGLFTVANDHLVGMICSNAKVYKPTPQDQDEQHKQQEQLNTPTSGKHDTEKLTTFTFVLPIGVIDYCYRQLYQQNKQQDKAGKTTTREALVDIDSKILDLWKLKPFHKDTYHDPAPMTTTLAPKPKL